MGGVWTVAVVVQEDFTVLVSERSVLGALRKRVLNRVGCRELAEQLAAWGHVAHADLQFSVLCCNPAVLLLPITCRSCKL